jgi:hypothetical protein
LLRVQRRQHGHDRFRCSQETLTQRLARIVITAASRGIKSVARHEVKLCAFRFRPGNDFSWFFGSNYATLAPLAEAALETENSQCKFRLVAARTYAQ